MKDIKLIFGCLSPPEVVGPTEPRSIESGTVAKSEYPKEHAQHPTLWMNFHKYHSGLPPWRNVAEMIVVEGGTEMTLVNIQHRETKITGTLKTVNVSASEMLEGNKSLIIADDYTLRDEANYLDVKS